MLIIQEWIERFGISPSYEELAAEIDVRSKGNIVRLVDALEQRGYLRRGPGRARTLTVLVPVRRPEEPEFVGLYDAPAMVELLAGDADVAP
jgi:repressor LexA